MQTFWRTVHKWVTALISIGVFVQMFLAGVWHAGLVQTPEAHVFFGLGLLLMSLVALIASLAGRMPRAVVGRTALLFGLILLQPILIETRRNGLPFFSAFHTLNAAFIGMLSGIVAKTSSAKAAAADAEMVAADSAVMASSAD